jgi:hypothetical protein
MRVNVLVMKSKSLKFITLNFTDGYNNETLCNK